MTRDGSRVIGTSDAPTPLPLHRIVVPPRPLALPAGAWAWHVTRYEDVWTVLTDPRFTRVGIFGWADEAVETPKHLVRRAFTPRRIATWRPWVASVIAELVDALIDTGSPADLVAPSRRRCRCG